MHQKALGLFEALGYKKGIAELYGNQCVVYGSRMELEKAEEMCRKALAMQETLGNKKDMAIDYTNLGNIYARRGELEKAREMYQKALALFKAVGAERMVKKVEASLDSLNKSRAER
ncbi:MAG: tetratricopeptide repeat protein [bacterium]